MIMGENQINPLSLLSIDIDECTSSTHPHMCDLNSDCEDMDPGYQCTCHSGYTLNIDGRTCSGKIGTVQKHCGINTTST